MTLRLTLRTLLSYLDDTLEPSEAKNIGAKVAESEQARELMERIKQVTRRRRLTTPPSSGPGGMDANTIAEYLDNDVTPEKAAEVEQICLASDVHLAEVAACHQILTLVLGEPALVPPSAKQRMYALVKGPEAIHSRKPTKASSKADMDLSSEIEPDQDETLRLGVPAVGGKSDYRNLIFLVGGGALAACLLIIAVWQLVHNPAGTVQPKGDGGVRIAENKDGTKDALPKTEDKKVAKEENKETKDDVKPKVVAEKKEPKTDVEPKIEPKIEPPAVVDVKVENVKVKERTAIPFRKASDKQLPIGVYRTAPPAEPGVLLQAKADKNAWVRVGGSRPPEVISGRSVMSLPGSKSAVLLESGIEILLWGSQPEVYLDNPELCALESRILIHANDQLDADLTLQRGRIVVKNLKGNKDATVRVRFKNPTANEDEYFDVVLEGQDAAVAFERLSELNRNEPFYEDPKNPQRTGPLAMFSCYAYAKTANVRFRQLTFKVDKKQRPVLQWQSGQDQFGAPAEPFIPFWIKGVPTLPDDAEKARTYAVRASKALLGLLDTKGIDVALEEFVGGVEEAGQREIAMDKKISLATFAMWRHALRCFAATDDVGWLFNTFALEKTLPPVRWESMLTLHHWIGIDRDNDYVLLDALRKNYRKTESVKIMELFHLVSTKDAQDPAKYQQLIENLNNDLLPIRVLSSWHLYALVPAGRKIAYDPIAPRQLRETSVREWTRLVPPGQLPPSDAPPAKKDKK